MQIIKNIRKNESAQTHMPVPVPVGFEKCRYNFLTVNKEQINRIMFKKCYSINDQYII